MGQQRLKNVAEGIHDSIQYHFFFDTLFFSARVFRTESLDYSSITLYDGQHTKFVDNLERVQQKECDFLDVKNRLLELVVPNDRGLLKIKLNSRDIIIRFSSKHEFAWLDPGAAFGGSDRESVIHQPDLECSVEYEGETHQGRGYCKRYTWYKSPRYCYWSFYHCIAKHHALFFWTADAYFGAKYNYFKTSDINGAIFASDEKDTYHQYNHAYGIISRKKYSIHFNPITESKSHLYSIKMDAMLIQRYGNVIIKCNDEDFDGGPAFHEFFIGTLG